MTGAPRITIVTGVEEVSSSVITTGSSGSPLPLMPVMRKPPSSSENE